MRCLQAKNRKPKRQAKSTNGEDPRQESANIKQVQNVSTLTIKCMNQCVKLFQKISQEHNCTYKRKMQKNRQSHTQTIMYYACENSMQNEKNNNEKNLQQ